MLMSEKKKKWVPEKVDTILERLFSSLDLGIRVKQYQIWEVWGDVVGEPIARQAQPNKIGNMILWVNVSSSTWMQQLEFMRHDIIKKLNERIGETVIKDIRFRIGEISQETQKD